MKVNAKPTGRPRKEIDQKAFEGLCKLQCAKKEICDFFNISTKTLERWCKETYQESFVVVFDKKRVDGKISLRRNMFRLSENNAAVAIFLAKNWLGFRDIPLEPGDAEAAKPIPVIYQVEDGTKNNQTEPAPREVSAVTPEV